MVDPRKPSQVAKVLNVSADTIRRYAELYAGHLSAAANPGPGRPRAFTEEDIATLRYILQLKAENLSAEEIADRLASGVVAAGSELARSPTEAPPALPAEAVAALQRLSGSLESLATTLGTTVPRLQADNEEMRRRVALVEARQSDTRRLAWVLALGVILGVLLVLVGAAIFSGIVQ